MAERIRVGDRLPFFLYDTPYSAGNRFRDLLDAQAPLVLVFMANFGHPITRTFASRYADTYTSLHDGGFALVVRSRADKLARSIGPDTLPYPLLCDAAGVLYEHLSIPTSKSTLMSYSLEGWRILREAKKQGYQPVKGAEQQLPLTLILDRDGAVLFFVVQMEGIQSVQPNDATHPAFGAALRQAAKQGVQVLARGCRVEPSRLEMAEEFPVVL